MAGYRVRAYVASNLPVNGEVIVTHASPGPSKFSIRLKNTNWEYQQMRSELESCTLHPLSAPPEKGTACIVVKSDRVHRGLVLSISHDQHTCNVCLVDLGCVEALPLKMLFEIPDEMMAYRLFTTSVSLVDGEALSNKPGVNEIFNTLVSSLDPIISEVVGMEATQQVVNLFDTKRQSIAGLVLGLYNNLVPKLRALSPVPPSIPDIEICDPELKLVEKLFVMSSHRVGHFYGQLLSRPTCELSEIFNDLIKLYESNPLAKRLDVGSFIGYTAVVKWSDDGRYYRCRILNETANDAEVSLIDFGDIITVPRRDLFAPVRTDRFCQPAFGIHCVISREGGALLKKKDWDKVLIEKSVEVRIGRKKTDGTYSVAFTGDPLNQMVLELLPPTTPAVVEIPRAQLSTSPNTASLGTPAALNKIDGGVSAKKPSPTARVYQHPNNRMSLPTNNSILERPAAGPIIQQVVRSPRGPPSTGTGFRGFVKIEPTTLPKATDASVLLDKASPSIRSVPAPTGTYGFLDTSQHSVVLACFYNFDRFYLTPSDVTTYETELESLKGFYNALSASELVEDSPKVGLPCVVRFMEDNQFYRSQIVSILPDQTAQILFVDYGNEQLTPLTEIKRILPEYMKVPQLVWPCKLAGIDGFQQGSDVTLSNDEEFITTFISVDKGVHLVKVLHKTYGDMSAYLTKNSLPVLRPAVVQLRDPKHKLCPDGYDVYVSYTKSTSEFWIQLKADEQIINDVGEELAQHVERGARRVECPGVGQLYAMEFPDVGGYYRARVTSYDGKMVHATFVDYGDAHAISTAKVFYLPARLVALPPLSIRCSMRRQKWPMEAEKRFVSMTSDPATVFRSVFQSASDVAVHVVDSLSVAGKNIEEDILAGIEIILKNDSGAVKVAAPLPRNCIAKGTISAPLPQKIQVPEPSLDAKKAFPPSRNDSPRPALSNLWDPSIKMQAKDHDVYISYSKSPTEFWIQLKADEDIVHGVAEELIQHMEKAPLRVARPIVGQLYVVEHTTLGGYYRARVNAFAGDKVEACFVDYGDVLPVPIEKVFSSSARLKALPPLAACCRMKRQDWSAVDEERFISITSNLESIFRASFGSIVGKSVREVEALFLDGKNIEDDIFPKQNGAGEVAATRLQNDIAKGTNGEPLPQNDGNVKAAAPLPQKYVKKATIAAPLLINQVPELSTDAKQALPRPAVSDLRDSSIEIQTKDYDVYISYSKSPTQFWIQLKADEDIVNGVAEELIQHMEKAPLRVARPIIGQFYVMEHPTLGGHYRARVTAFAGDTVEACFVDYGVVLPVPIEKVFSLSARLKALPPLAVCCRMKRQDWPQEAINRFVSTTSNLEVVFRASFGPIFSKSVREVEALYLDGKNVEDDIFPKQDLELTDSKSTSAVVSTKETKSAVKEEKALPRPAIMDLRDPSKPMNADGYDVYVSYVKSPSEFWIQLKADEELVNKVGEDLTQELGKAELPIVLDQLYAVEHPSYGGKFRARITYFNGVTAEAFFVDYGDVHPVPIQSIFDLPEHLRLLPLLATCCCMKRLEWPLEANTKFISITSNADEGFRATIGPMDNAGVHLVDSLLVGGENIEDNIFPKLQANKLVDESATAPSTDEKKVLLRPAISDLSNNPGTFQLEGYEVYVSSVSSPSKFYVQLKTDEDLINNISCQLDHFVRDDAAIVERPLVDQLYVMKHPILGGYYRVRITPMDADEVEACLVDYGETHFVPSPKIYQLPEHLKELPSLAARCSMKCDKWAPETKDRFVTIVSDLNIVFRAVFDPVKKDGTLQIVSLFQDEKNIEDTIFDKLCDNFVTPDTVQDPVVEKVDPSLSCSREGVELEVEKEESTESLKKTGYLKEEMANSDTSVDEEEEVFFRYALSGSCDPRPNYETVASVGPIEETLTSTLHEGVVLSDPEVPNGPDSDVIQPETTLVADCLKNVATPFEKSSVVEPLLDEEKREDLIPLGNLISLDDGGHPTQDTTSVLRETPSLIDLLSAPVEEILQDNILIPVVEVPQLGSSCSANKKTFTDEQVGSLFVYDEPSESAFTNNILIPDSIFATGICQNGPVINIQQAGSILMMDKPPIPSEMELTTAVEEDEQQPASILIKEVCDLETPTPAELVAIEDADTSDRAVPVCPVRDDEQPAAAVLIEDEKPSDPVAERAGSLLKESDSVSTDTHLIVQDETPSVSSGGFETIAQFVEVVAPDADGKSNDPAPIQNLFFGFVQFPPDKVASFATPEVEVEEQSVGLITAFDLKPKLVAEEGSTTVITEPVNLAADHEEFHSGLEVHPVEQPSGTVSDPVAESPVLFTLQHFVGADELHFGSEDAKIDQKSAVKINLSKNKELLEMTEDIVTEDTINAKGPFKEQLSSIPEESGTLDDKSGTEESRDELDQECSIIISAGCDEKCVE